MDWRILSGLSITSLWIGTGLFYLIAVVGSGNFVQLPTADIGSFLEGAFAPLAFLWLVIGHFMQQKEISSNTRVINLQEQSARRLELHSRRDSYFKLLNLVQNQLGATASFHYMSICGPTGTGEITGSWMLASGLSFVVVTGIVRYLGTDLPAAQSAFLRHGLGRIPPAERHRLPCRREAGFRLLPAGVGAPACGRAR